jgi:translation initiation factor eIF-2B subunit epsilon
LHPLVIDSKLLCPKNNYTFQSFNKYFDTDVQVALNTLVSSNCMIGKFSTVGTHCSIEISTIGEKCTIGKNVKITNCYIWNNVEIQDGCELTNVIISDGVVVKKGAKILSGSMISFGIVVREGVTVPAGTMASRYTFNSESMVFEKTKEASSELFENGVISYIPRECQLTKGEYLGDANPFNEDEDSDFEEDEEGDEENDREEFLKEVKSTLERCVKNKFSIQNAVMEVKNLKMTYNMDYSDCIEASYPVLLDLIGLQEGSDDNAKRAKNIQTTLTEWKPFFKDFVRELID